MIDRFAGPFITVHNEHDRTEFIRDAAAALRLDHPRAARAFIARLCRRRASVELYAEMRGRLITKADMEHLHTSRTHELQRLCEAMGFYETQLTHVEVKALPNA